MGPVRIQHCQSIGLGLTVRCIALSFASLCQDLRSASANLRLSISGRDLAARETARKLAPEWPGGHSSSLVSTQMTRLRVVENDAEALSVQWTDP